MICKPLIHSTASISAPDAPTPIASFIKTLMGLLAISQAFAAAAHAGRCKPNWGKIRGRKVGPSNHIMEAPTP